MDIDASPRTLGVAKIGNKPKTTHHNADFETAITAAGFGKFNFLLCLCLIPTAWSQVFETTNLSYVLPIAACDLDLTLEQKGILNSASFAGMILSGFFWGYLSDIFGRRKIMVCGYFMDWCCIVMASLSQNFYMLLSAKFVGGFIVNGPFSAVASLLAEFHSSEYRSRVQLIRGIIVALGAIVMPLLSWSILPVDLHFSLFGFIEIRSWNIFLLVCSAPAMTGGIIFLFMPESPKFLMTKGRNEEALDVFRRVYSMNFNKPRDQYPIKSLANEGLPNGSPETFRRRSIHIIRGFIETVKPLFTKEHVFKLILSCANVFMLMMSYNTMKLWLPQLLQATNDYQQSHGTTSHICDMIHSLVPSNDTSESCSVNLDNSAVYQNSTLFGLAQVALYGLVALIIGKISEKMCFGILATISGISSITIYACQDMPTIMTLFAASLSGSGVCGNISMTLALEIFPTSFRTSALSLNLMSARLGSVIGSSVFPYLLKSGCLPPFLFFGLLTIGSALTVFLFPDTRGKMLK